QLGGAVAVSGDVLVVGARWEDSHSSGVNGDQGNNSASDSGAAYVFARSGGTWSQQAYLKASNPRNDHWFGDAVAIFGETIVVGAQYEGSSATGVNGNQSDTGAWASGAAYVFEGNAGAWSQRAYLKASNTDANDRFACSVALSGSLLVVGARLESSDATGINGNQASNNASYSGAAYLFELKAQVANYCGVSVPNSSGHSAHLSFSGSLDPLVNTFALHAEDLPLGQYGYFINSRGQDFVINPGSYSGYLCLGGTDSVGRHHSSIQNSGATGRIEATIDLQNFPTALGHVTIEAGETLNFQCWFRDQNPGNTSNFTDGLSVRFE
ncbi:MAG: hypothetical protein P1V35_08395, partial [Planctomycetota bacterium]|nr:hypothetical protein [Planctomycetota bacterium]